MDREAGVAVLPFEGRGASRRLVPVLVCQDAMHELEEIEEHNATAAHVIRLIAALAEEVRDDG